VRHASASASLTEDEADEETDSRSADNDAPAGAAAAAESLFDAAPFELLPLDPSSPLPDAAGAVANER
jgi:hypothetical protein